MGTVKSTDSIPVTNKRGSTRKKRQTGLELTLRGSNYPKESHMLACDGNQFLADAALIVFE